MKTFTMRCIAGVLTTGRRRRLKQLEVYEPAVSLATLLKVRCHGTNVGHELLIESLATKCGDSYT